MALFSRRAIQHRLDALRTILETQQLARFVSRLNNPNEDHVAVEWEVAVLSALAKLGTVRYEPSQPGSTRPDVVLAGVDDEPPVAIDITTVSDKGFHARNPLDEFMAELRERIAVVRSAGIKGGFHVEVGSNWQGLFHEGHINLKLPPVDSFSDGIFNDAFDQFLGEILAAPDSCRDHQIKNDKVEVFIAFDPRSRGLSTTHPTYTVPKMKRQNPLAHRLKSKAVQFLRSGFRGPFGVVICDGDCDMLSSGRYGSWFGDSYSVRDVVFDFFQRFTSLSFVFVIAIRVQSIMEMHRGPKNLEYSSQTFANPQAARQISDRMIDGLKALPSTLPIPMRTARGIQRQLALQRKHGLWFEGRSFRGGVGMSDCTAKISARSILDLLAGQMSHEDFLRMHRVGGFNPFELMREKGRSITNVRIEKSEVAEDDDEWLVFEFGRTDPAISPFRTPGPDL